MITDEPINFSQLLEEFRKTHPCAGGIVSFLGQVRPDNGKASVTALHLQAYEPLTSRNIKIAIETAKSKWPLEGAIVKHRIGDMSPEDVIVFVATAAIHRRDAFEAADFLMDYLKTEAIFWKKETTDRGESWIEPRQEDYKDAKRWTNDESGTIA